MTITKDFYEIVNVQDGGIIQEAIGEGMKKYLESLGYDTEIINFDIVIHMYVNDKENDVLS